MTAMLTATRLDELLDKSRAQRVVVVGDAMLDVYLTGDVERVSPEAPVPVVRVRDQRSALGGAANVAQNVVAIGARCQLVATVGRDAAGERLAALLRGLGAGDHLLSVGRCTTEKTRIVARGQQVVRFDVEDESDLDGPEQDALLECVAAAVSNATALVLEDYNKGVLTSATISAAMQMGRERQIPVVVDPKYRNFFRYSGATIFKPNVRELESALGAAIDLEHPETLPALVDRLGVANILLTMGERGMVLFSADGEVARIPTTARKVFDVVGAGDTVTAYLATILAAGGSPTEAAIIANAAAGIEVGKLGAATVTPDEIREQFAAAPSP